MPRLLHDIFQQVVETPTQENLQRAKNEWDASKNSLAYDRAAVDLFFCEVLERALALHGPAPRSRPQPTYQWDIFEIQNPWTLAEIKDVTIPHLLLSLELYLEKQKVELQGFENMRRLGTSKISNTAIRDWRCGICLEGWKPGTRLAEACAQTKGVVHAFHTECIGRWAEKNSSCPRCRAPLTVVPVPNVLAHGGAIGKTLTARLGGLLPRRNKYTVDAP